MYLGMVNMPLYTGITVALLAVIQVVLMFRVIAHRGKTEVLIGTGGVESLEQRIRVHANFIENAPTFMVLLLLIEIMAGSTLWVAGLAGVFVVSRLAHAIGFSLSSGVTAGRLVGTLGSMLCLVAGAGYLFYLVLTRL